MAETATATETIDSSEWARVRLSFALEDAKANRLDGVVGQYRRLSSLIGAPLPLAVCDGYRALAKTLEAGGRDDLAALATSVAALLDRTLANKAVVGAPSEAHERSHAAL